MSVIEGVVVSLGVNVIVPVAVGGQVSILRTLLSELSEKTSNPDGLKITSTGEFRFADVASVPSGEPPNTPFPAMVVIMPVPESIRRITELKLSVIYRLSATSNNRWLGYAKAAAVASPPSPEYAGTPVPVNVVMIPVALSTLRTLALCWSAMNRLPAESKVIPNG